MTTETDTWKQRVREMGDITDLMAEQFDLNLERAPVYAAYGTFGVWENRRKVTLSILDVEERANAEQAGRKVTDKSVDAITHANPTYIAMIDDAERGRTALAVIDAKLLFLEGLIAKLRADDYRRNG